jgi:hypothetical protein
MKGIALFQRILAVVVAAPQLKEGRRIIRISQVTGTVTFAKKYPASLQ